MSEYNKDEYEILKKSLCTLKVPKNIIDKIKSSTSCEKIKDLWVLTSKELCVHIGLTMQELVLLINEMERVAKNMSSRRFLVHIDRCRRYLEVYKNYIPKEELERAVTDYILEPEYCTERENSTELRYMNISIADIGLSVRAYNCLIRAGINNVYEVLNKSLDDLRSIRNLGTKCTLEVLTKLMKTICIADLEGEFSKVEIKQLLDELLINGITLKGDKIEKCAFCGNKYIYITNFLSNEQGYCAECVDKIKRVKNIRNIDVELEVPCRSTFRGGEEGFYITASIKNITKKLCRVKLNEFYLVSNGRKWEPNFFLTGYQFEDEDLMPDTIKSVAKIWCGNRWKEKFVEEDDYIVLEFLIKDNVKQMYRFVCTKSGWRKDDFFSVRIK